MSGMTGELLAHHVMSKCPEFSVILFSGFGYTMNKAKAFAMGLRAYLPKPVLMGDMGRALQVEWPRSYPFQAT